MQTLYITNSCFEEEIEQEKSFQELIQKKTLYKQLQFLAFLYASKDDFVLCLDTAANSYFTHLKNILGDVARVYESAHLNACKKISCWGKSPSIEAFAQTLNLSIPSLSYKVLQTINSKEFSFNLGKPLVGAAILRDLKEMRLWINQQTKPFVFKTILGLSGKGHFIGTRQNETVLIKAETFANKQFIQGLPIIAEPWVERSLDFSTQWLIEEDLSIHYLGETICLNDEKGKYIGTQVGKQSLLFIGYEPYLEEHIQYVRQILCTLVEYGYTGNVGFDAFLYKTESALILNPLVEINVRKTMGFVALQLFKKFEAAKYLKIFLAPSHTCSAASLLPNEVITKESIRKHFNVNLFLEVVKA